MKAGINYQMAAAVGELSESYEFLMRIAKLDLQQMFEAIRSRDPSFIEHLEAMEDPPENAYEFWAGFGSWTMTFLRFKYGRRWDEVLESYLESPLHESHVQRVSMWSDIAQVLKECEF